MPGPGSDSIALLPRSLVAMINETAYPPTKPRLMDNVAPSVLMIVDAVSSTPLAMLDRAKNLDYRASDHILRTLAQQPDPAKALTAECSRVFEMIANNIQSNTFGTATLPDAEASWTRFEDMGFSNLSRKAAGNTTNGLHSRSTSTNEVSSPPRRVSSRPNQTWADFMSTGFSDEDGTSPPPLSLPAKQFIPAIAQDNGALPDHNAQSLLPGELARVEQFRLDETFWWVWMQSLAPEETLDRRAVFGRCILAELNNTGTRWLIIEEQIRPAVQTIQDVASPSPTSPERKRPFFATKKSRTSSSQRQMSSNSMQRVSSSQQTPTLGFNNNDHHDTGYSSAQSTPAIGVDQHALIQAAAAQLVQKINTDDSNVPVAERRGRKDADSSSKTVSVLSLQPVFVSDAGPALQWARRFEKEITRSRFDDLASETTSVSDAALPNKTVPPAYSATQDMTSSQPQASAGLAESSSIAAVEAILHPPETTSPREEMIPSPLRIPKRKPVAISSNLSPDAGTSHMTNAQSTNVNSDQVQGTTAVNDAPTTTNANGPALQKSKTGSKRGLRDLFKRKVTDPEAKPTNQRAVSGPAQRVLSSSTIAEHAEDGQQEARTVTRKRSLLRKKLERAAASKGNGALAKEPVAISGEPSSRSSISQVERKKFGPEAPKKVLVMNTEAQEQPHNVVPPAAADAVEEVQMSPTMTPQSAVFGAARPGMLDDATTYIEPPSPAFSNFTSAANMEQDRTTTMSTVPDVRHARTETLQSMPAYALGFDSGSPQRTNNLTVDQHNGEATYQTRAAALLAPQQLSLIHI